MSAFLQLMFFIVVAIHCSAVFALPAGSNSTSPGIVAGANNTGTDPGILGATNATTPGGVVDGNSSIPSNQSTQPTLAPTAGSPPPVVLQGSVSILPPAFPQQAQSACPSMCQSNQGCQPPCPRPCCQQQPLQSGRSAVPHAKKCQCQEKCQTSHRNKKKCLVRCERVCERRDSIFTKRENKRHFHSKVSKF